MLMFWFVQWEGTIYVVLTFKYIEERDSMFNNGKMAWLKGFFVDAQKWEELIYFGTTISTLSKSMELSLQGDLRGAANWQL